MLSGDFNDDRRVDIYVANDGEPNQLWINRSDGTFGDWALLSGTAVNAMGRAEAGMGVCAADFDLDGDEDIFVTHLLGETNTLYMNEGEGQFVDATDQTGLGAPSLAFTSFGVGWIDYDNDGLLDLFVANGGIKRSEPRENHPFPYRMKNQLFHQDQENRFVDVSATSGSVFDRPETSRGAAFGDIDNDGDVDVVVVNLNAPLQLLVNQVGQMKNWVTLRLIGSPSNRDGIGAWIGLDRRERPTLWRRVHRAESCYSSGDVRVHFG